MVNGNFIKIVIDLIGANFFILQLVIIPVL